MKEFSPDLNRLMQSPEAAKLLKNKEALSSLAQSAEIQDLMNMLKEKSGGNLQAVAAAAMKGDTSQLTRLVNEVSQNPNIAKTVTNLGGKLPK